MAVALITGAAGLIGGEVATLAHAAGLDVLGVDNDMRGALFGAEASTAARARALQAALPRYVHHALDIRDAPALAGIFARVGRSLALVVHCAAQPSHDWAARAPQVDFAINATATLSLLELTRAHAPEAAFVFASTNKVYGDAPNELPLHVAGRRFECDPAHRFAAAGIDETMRVDRSLHSVFGASKLAADIMVQEYGRYFGLRTGVLRGGCLTGPAHRGTALHGFLSYLVRCQVHGRPYMVYGHGGLQVRDNIHSADYARAVWQFFAAPRAGAVYNIGGGRRSCCSLLEAADAVAALCGRPLRMEHVAEPRRGDHRWYISDMRRFCGDYPGWTPRHALADTLAELVEAAGDAAAA